MKKYLFLLVALLSIAPSTFAQRNDRSVMRIRLSDGSPLTVTINGRDFKKVGRSVTIGDIPKKRQYVQVYRFRPYADGNGGKAELAYSGNIKIQKGGTYDCVVDSRTRKLRMKQVGALQPLPSTVGAATSARNTPAVGSQPVVDENPVFEMPPDRTAPSHLQNLKAAMEKVDADSKKLAEAKKYIANNSLSTQDVKFITEWIFFDDNRIQFIKAAYPKVSDKENFSQVGSVFTLEDSKKLFDDFMRDKK